MSRTAVRIGDRREAEEEGEAPGVVSLSPALCADVIGPGSSICAGWFACSMHDL